MFILIIILITIQMNQIKLLMLVIHYPENLKFYINQMLLLIPDMTHHTKMPVIEYFSGQLMIDFMIIVGSISLQIIYDENHSHMIMD